MKKTVKSIALGLATVLTLGITPMGIALAETSETTSTKIYLVPGENNAVGTGATKLTEEQCAEIFTPNAYLCEVNAGEKLPTATTEREGYTFNGWWGIEDATVTYYDTVPKVSKTTFLYADFRTALSQPRDPIVPDENEEQEYEHYMEVTRAATGEKEHIPLFVSGTDVPNAVQAGYGGPVQFYNEWFQMSEGDDVQFFISRVYGNLPVIAPQGVAGKRKITLENSGTSSTASNIKCLVKGEIPENAFSGDYSVATNGEPQLRCVREGENNYRIYIKFYDNGGTMTIYMEKLNN